MPDERSGAVGTRLADLLGALRSSATLEQAAFALLRELVGVVTISIESAAYRKANLERCVLHLRPEGGYQALLMLQPGRDEVETPEEDPSFLSSATAWRHIQEHAAPVALDVLTGILVVDPGGASSTTKSTGFDGKQTLSLMRRRQTTHSLVMPLPDVGGTLAGQISLEAHCPQAVGKPFVWPACTPILRELVDLAAPYLLRLPAKGRTGEAEDPMLPVVGDKMRPIVRNLRVFAQHDETILLLGATGTGKSRMARWCHLRSHRAEGPFEIVDLNAVPADLQQGELFGWRKGSFTGAARDQVGAVGRANAGTLFIDEVDKLDLRAQASLLRVLEDGSYRAMGASHDETGDVRFVVGTNADLDKAIAEGRFLIDLYYRINVLPIRLPTLWERRDEITPWACFMVERRAGERGPVMIAPGALSPLLDHRWPGNLRQLDNVIRRAFALALVSHQEQDPRPDRLTIEHEHVVAALMMEQSNRGAEAGQVQGAPNLDAADALLPMQRAADWVAEQAAQRYERGQALPLDTVTSAFRGLVMMAAMDRNEAEAAFESLGRGNLVKSRNHQKSLRTAKEQIEALRAIVRES
ncbi:MAG: sigma 54-interacting transcriptional regulator [Myxococcota bacterium]